MYIEEIIDICTFSSKFFFCWGIRQFKVDNSPIYPIIFLNKKLKKQVM